MSASTTGPAMASPEPGEGPPREQLALEDIYRRHIRFVLLLLRRLGVREADLEDAAHEVFLVVLRRLPEYEPRGRMTAWLGAITGHVASRFRHNGSREPLMNDDEPAKLRDGTDLERTTAERDLVLRLLEVIEPERRLVLVLHELDGLPMPEIAQALELPEGTAWNRLRLARQDLKLAWKRLSARDRAIAPLGLDHLIERERQAPPPPPPPAMEERLWSRLHEAAPLTRNERTRDVGERVPASAPRSPWPAGALAGLGLLAGIAIGALLDPLHRSPPAPSLPQAVAVATTAPRVEVVRAPPEPSDADAGGAPPELTVEAPSAPPPAASSAPPNVAATSSAALEILATERALTNRAAEALAAHDSASALTALQEHARRFPTGRLAEDREALWIMALVRAGRSTEASRQVERFARAHPNSPRLKAFQKAIAGSGR